MAHDGGLAGFVLVVGGAGLAVAAAAWLVRRFSPYGCGSGMPHVGAALDRQLPPAPPRLILVKFFGGLLAIGSGLALGREGPSVQMGAVVAHIVGRIAGRGWPDRRALLAAGAGAGLAVAFNAPIAGAIFVLEELVRRFDTRIAIAALGASGDPCCPPVSRRRARLSGVDNRLCHNGNRPACLCSRGELASLPRAWRARRALGC